MAQGHVTSSQIGFGVTAVGGVGAGIAAALAKHGDDLGRDPLFVAFVVIFFAGLIWLILTGSHAGYVWAMAKRKKKGRSVARPEVREGSGAALKQSGGVSHHINPTIKGYANAIDHSGGELKTEGLVVENDSDGEEETDKEEK